MRNLHDFLVDAFYGIYKLFFDGIESSIQIFNSDLAVIPQVQQMMESVADVIQPICYTIAGIFFMIELLSLLKKEEVTEQDVFVMLIHLGLARFIIYYAPQLLNLLNITGNYWISKISVDSLDQSMLVEIKQTIADAIPKVTGGIWNWIGITILQLCISLAFLFNSVVLLVTYIVVMALAYARNFELVILTAISPIPFCFVPFSGTKEITKKFILAYAAVSLQGVIAMIVFSLYVAVMSSANTIINITIVSIVLMIGIVKSGSWAKEVLGLG